MIHNGYRRMSLLDQILYVFNTISILYFKINGKLVFHFIFPTVECRKSIKAIFSIYIVNKKTKGGKKSVTYGNLNYCLLC